jgi:hypothetical protein
MKLLIISILFFVQNGFASQIKLEAIPSEKVSTIGAFQLFPVIPTAGEVLLVDAISAAATVNLPPAISSAGRVYEIKKTDSSTNSVTVEPFFSETIDNAVNTTLNTQYETIRIICDGNAWYLLSRDYPSFGYSHFSARPTAWPPTRPLKRCPRGPAFKSSCRVQNAFAFFHLNVRHLKKAIKLRTHVRPSLFSYSDF